MTQNLTTQNLTKQNLTKDDFRIRLLIVDDEQTIRRLCITVGESLGFSASKPRAATPPWPCSKNSPCTWCSPTWSCRA
jgi:hypothetical protein